MGLEVNRLKVQATLEDLERLKSECNEARRVKLAEHIEEMERLNHGPMGRSRIIYQAHNMHGNSVANDAHTAYHLTARAYHHEQAQYEQALHEQAHHEHGHHEHGHHKQAFFREPAQY